MRSRLDIDRISPSENTPFILKTEWKLNGSSDYEHHVVFWLKSLY